MSRTVAAAEKTASRVYVGRRVTITETAWEMLLKQHMDRGKTLQQAERAIYGEMGRIASAWSAYEAARR